MLSTSTKPPHFHARRGKAGQYLLPGSRNPPLTEKVTE